MIRRITTCLREHRDAIIAILACIAAYGIMFALGYTCPVKAATGISCPGCGMTRAWLSVLRLDLPAAWAFHPLFLLPLVWIAAYLCRERYPFVYKACTALSIAAVLVVYAVRMMDPTDSIVVFKPSEGILFRWMSIFIVK